MYIGFNSWTHEYQMTFKCLRTSLTDFHIEPQTTVRAYAAMEQAIPTGPDAHARHRRLSIPTQL